MARQNLIAVIFSMVILVAVMAWVTGTLISNIPDNSGVLGPISTYLPVITSMIMIAAIVLVVGLIIRSLSGGL